MYFNFKKEMGEYKYIDFFLSAITGNTAITNMLLRRRKCSNGSILHEEHYLCLPIEPDSKLDKYLLYKATVSYRKNKWNS